ncbi:glycosyltransferase family protein [Rhizobium johnstonii]|uniref:cytidylyltransferase domain-containing protein n=1 Tax=Rhizobium TaxID=379 RepID=UPI0010301919|nr:glycosyltransferase family protein [Rhizobium leguminosarum]NKL59224.1 acylneuraminate cytidylyltransferase [Rhizobium leguminosarum bv. viciae]WSG96177.1 glycosyltransferase family protein [Rhizobium johnstonii]NEH98747.1 acylneuraminate cytidylyltransferase [Rhizobium leguminosarum]NEI56196.1 acylneuraminate cytidylyltransferase [Rhizobium leguminosarum]NEI85045.1 acylneuraminate cytidylyltransferase [Rhizobium leguminosarum]
MTLGIIIQARMGSTRLPGKVLRDISGKPLLEHVLGRLQMLTRSAKVVVATSSASENDIIEAWCLEHGVSCFRGDETDVLDRYFQCAESLGMSDIVRLTADNPFTDIEELERLIDLHHKQGFDYTHAFGQLPIGVGAEIFTFEALSRSHREGNLPHHREHVNEYFTDRPELFKIGQLEVPPAKISPELRLTVDTEEDWRRACALVARAEGNWLGTEEAIRLCSSSA